MDTKTIRRNKVYERSDFDWIPFATIVIFSCLVSCEKPDNIRVDRKRLPDPYAKSFYGKKLRMAVGYNKESVKDTLENAIVRYRWQYRFKTSGVEQNPLVL